MATTITSSNPIQNCLNDIQHRLYTFQQNLCTTDNKVYAFLILGRVLQAAALASVIAAIAFTFTVGPMVLLATIPAIALGLLGTYAAGNPEEINNMLQMARPFVPGQPVGLVNGGSDCWLNSSLQLMVNSPAYHQRMRQIPQLTDFLDAYQANRTNYQKVAKNIDIHAIRQFLSRETGGQIRDSYDQEDAAQFFEYLFQGPNAVHQLDQQVNGRPPRPRPEALLQIDLGESPRPSFQQLFNSYFDQTTDLGERSLLHFQRPPNDLLVHAKRFYFHMNPDGTLYRDANGRAQERKVTDPIDVPERLSLPNRFVRSGEASEYTCDGFSVHSGSSPDGGHYTCYVKRQNTWWYCSDTNVFEVTSCQAHNAMKHGYLFHYAKSSP